MLNPLTFRTCLQSSIFGTALVDEGSALVTLKTADGFKLQLTKSVLYAHSPVLKAALESAMLEGTSGEVLMADVSKDVLSDFALCLCSLGLPDRIVTGWKRLLDLLVVANKYGVRALCDAITKVLFVSVTKSTIGDLLVYADIMGLLPFRRGLIRYIAFKQGYWDSLRDTDPYCKFTADLFRDILAHWSIKPSWNEKYGSEPLFMQWADDDHEFEENTCWEELPGDALRRACCERHLATSGTSAELAARLAAAVPTSKEDALDAGSTAKRAKTE